MINLMQPSTIDYIAEINRLKAERNAVILAHYYQEAGIQDIADFIGDSLALAQAAAKTTADVIVFAGVHFMAETAKILNPSKTVLVPDMAAGCSLADTCPAPELQKLKDQYPNYALVSYVNCTADVKAISDVICTSSNAVKIINSIPKEQGIIFAPDRNLGRYLIQETGREMVLWDGSCMVHELFSAQKLANLIVKHPEAVVLAHPECETPVLDQAHFIGSTLALLNYVKAHPQGEFIVVTEPGIIHQMEKAAPNAKFIPAPPDNNCACNECPYMRLNTLEKIYNVLNTNEPQLLMEEAQIQAAYKPLQRMLDLS